jgi:hypothetical protein
VRSARHAKAQMVPAVERLRQARAQAEEVRADLNKRIAKLFDFSDSFSGALLATEVGIRRLSYESLGAPTSECK